MAYFADLAPYSYGNGSHPGVVHVGWLDGAHPFSEGPVDHRLVEKLKLLAANPVGLYRGKHLCELCAEPVGIIKTFVPDKGRLINPGCSWMLWAEQRLGNGEIRISHEGEVFAAPVLVVHYIEAHGYLPPARFLRAVEAA